MKKIDLRNYFLDENNTETIITPIITGHVAASKASSEVLLRITTWSPSEKTVLLRLYLDGTYDIIDIYKAFKK